VNILFVFTSYVEKMAMMSSVEYDLDTSGGLMPVSRASLLGKGIVAKWRILERPALQNYI
jgi:hypothetical protein